MTEPTIPVQGEPGGSVAGATTPAASGVATATTTTPPADADAKLKEYETRITEAEQLLQQREKDIRNIKSSLQRREGELTRDFQQRERDYQRQLEQLRLGTMDEDERKIYEQELKSQRVSELEEELANVTREREQATAMTNAYIYFTRNGIPVDRLILDQGYDALYQSGMEAMEQELQKLHTAPAAPPTPPTPPAPPSAPPVVTATGAPAGTKPTWPELVAKYGSEEAVYSLVEQGRLPREIIP